MTMIEPRTSADRQLSYDSTTGCFKAKEHKAGWVGSTYYQTKLERLSVAPAGLAGGITPDASFDRCPETLRLEGLELEFECSGFDTDAELAHMRRLVNEWEWNPGFGQGGQHRWRDSELLLLYRPVTDSDIVARMAGQSVPRVSDQVLVVVTSAAGSHYVVKCDLELLQPQEMIQRCRMARWAPTRSQLATTWPNGGSKQHNWLEPVEYLRAGSGQVDHDDACDLAKRWSSQIQAQWADDLQCSPTSQEIVFSPDRMPHGSTEDYQAVLDEVLATIDRYGELKGMSDEESFNLWEGVDMA